MSYAVVIPAAGSGSRMGADVPKVLLQISTGGDGESILARTVRVFADDPGCQVIVVCVPAVWRDAFQKELSGFKAVHMVDGGETRQESVRLGVEFLAAALELPGDAPVLVHDAARCCVSSDVVARVLEGVRLHGAVTAGVRIVDSLCREDGGAVQAHVDREKLWAIQTPQGFFLNDIRQAHNAARISGIAALDDAALVARFKPVQLVLGDRFNIKVTEPADLVAARAVFTAREQSGLKG